MKPDNLKPFIKGSSVDLRPLSLADVEGTYVDWFNDAEICQFNSHHTYPYNRELAAKYVSDAQKQKNMLVLAIVTKDGKHIGNVSLQEIDYISRNAEYAIIIGDKDYWGRGIGEESSRLLFTHGFKALNLHRVYCGTSAFNVPMQKLAILLGMKEEGRRRETLYKNGEYVDIIEYGLLKKDFSVL
ncbi:MAG: GNAT family protein [Candidatus Paceibacterota bacterium]|jgi:RimJ/RimL family protein N-acetyltransferase